MSAALAISVLLALASGQRDDDAIRLDRIRVELRTVVMFGVKDRAARAFALANHLGDLGKWPVLKETQYDPPLTPRCIEGKVKAAPPYWEGGDLGLFRAKVINDEDERLTVLYSPEERIMILYFEEFPQAQGGAAARGTHAPRAVGPSAKGNAAHVGPKNVLPAAVQPATK